MPSSNKRIAFTAEERTIYQRLSMISLADCGALIDKGRSYGSSWKQRGGTGAFMMLARKWDRLENAVKKHGYDVFEAAEHDKRAEGILDDIRDLRRYLLLVEDHISRDVWSEMGYSFLVEDVICAREPSDEDDDDEASSMRDHAQSISLEVHNDRPEVVHCMICLSSEHLEAACPLNKPICTLCHNPGHYSRDCPDR